MYLERDVAHRIQRMTFHTRFRADAVAHALFVRWCLASIIV